MNNESNTSRTLVSDALNNLSLAVRYIGYLNPLTIHRKGKKAKAFFALFLVCFFWGTTWLASREAVKYIPALEVAGIRQFIGGTCYIIFFLAKGARLPRGREWGPIFMLSFLNFMLSNGLSTWGVKYISAGLGSIIGAIFPLWLVIIGMFGSKSRLHPRVVFGTVLGFSGICVIFYEHLDDFLDPSFRFGIFLSLASTWSWAFGTLYTKKHAVHFNPYFALGLQMVISGAALLGITAAADNFTPLADIPWQSWTSIAYLVIFGSILSFIAFIYALQSLPTEQVSLYAYINPIVAVAFGAVLFGEIMTPFIAVGVLITLAGVYLVNRTIQKLNS